MNEGKKAVISPESTRQPFWAMKIEEVFGVLESNPDGLAEKEVITRTGVFGKNEISYRDPLGWARIVLNQFRSPLILILVAAGALTLFLREWTNAVVIAAAVLVNTALGFYQENKAETALEALKSYVRTRARIKRAGREREIDSSELVPGDIIRISQGDRVPADARIFFSNSLEIDESVLTGESLPVGKGTDELSAGTALPERTCMAYGGTFAVQGFGDAIVVKSGNETEFGRIAALVEGKEREPTPLQRAMARFSSRAGMVLAVMVAALFILGVASGKDILEMFLIAVAVAVSAVPEGLPVALTVILAVGVERLAARRGVVRRLLAAETLGSVSLILTDKTGTLTQGKMELSLVLPQREKNPDAEKHLLLDAVLNTDVIIENPEDSPAEWRMFGRALEVALVRGAAERGVSFAARNDHQIIDRLPFGSEHKFSAALAHTEDHGHTVLFGAPDVLLGFTKLTVEERDVISRQIEDLARIGERVLGVVTKRVAKDHRKISLSSPAGFEFAGLLTFRDPLRPTVAEAVRRIKDAGVNTIIVTGDHKGTAEAVAREIGLVNGKGAVLTGDDLNYLKEDELEVRAKEVSVYARVTPEQKVLIANLYKKLGATVAVTGDGVNDAPALQAADIGVAVGSGTDVAKSAADLIVLDDNFETIVAAVEEGRRILDNIRKVIVYLLSDSLDELLLIGGAVLTGLALPLNALQILFVNFFSDSFPAVALAFEKGIDGLSSRPRRLDRNLFDPEVRFLLLAIGIPTSALLFGLYYALLKLGFGPELVRTFTFAAFGTYTLLLSFSIRSLEKSIFSYNPFSNKYLVLGVLAGILLTALVIYVPYLQSIFETAPLTWPWVLGVLGVGVLNILAVEFGKWIFRRGIIKM